MNMPRVVVPELLDELPPDDPHAIQSRKDLCRVNALMGNAQVVAELIERHAAGRPVRKIGEIGAGDGTFLLRVLQRTNHVSPKGVEVMLLDQKNLVREDTRRSFEHLGVRLRVVEADVFDWADQSRGEAPFDLLVCNLFLHHFSGRSFGRLLEALAQRTRLFIACEPRRSRLALLGSRMLWMIGCNSVTQHDAVVSVRAGFSDHEISASWPASHWVTEEGPGRFCSHAFAAIRNEEVA
jgi:phospholipid N-methyltransferase